MSITHSRVRGFNRVKTDGAGVYVHAAADVSISGNLVRDAPGSTAGTPWTTRATHGIYLDDGSERGAVGGNTVVNVGANGIYLHNTRGVTLTGNVLAGAREAGIRLHDDALSPHALQGTVVRGNTLVGTGVPLLRVQSSETPDLLDTLGAFDGNRYCDPFAAPRLELALPGRPIATLGLADWRQATGRDASSAACGPRLDAFRIVGTPGPDRVVNGAFDNGLDGWIGWPGDTLDARVETGRLDGPSLRLAHAGPSPTAHVDATLGALPGGRRWLLEFSAETAAGAPLLDVYLRERNDATRRLSSRVTLVPAATRTEHALLLEGTLASSDALLVFEMRQGQSAVGLDNIRLRPVQAEPRPLFDAVQVRSNPTTVERSMTVGSDAVLTLDGTRWAAGAGFTLPPFGSVVLLRP